MRYLISLLVINLLFACNGTEQKSETENNNTKDSVTTTPNVDSTANVLNEDDAFSISDEILKTIKEKNFKKIGDYIHPTEGLRLSPYVYVDTAENRKFSKEEFLALAGSQTKINWGATDAGEDSIYMSLAQYFDRYVMDADFLKAEKRSFNKSLSSGTLPSNVNEVYPSADFVEYYFPGFEKKYDGMDWKSLKLVFKKYGDRIFLIAIIHGEWTT